MIRAKPGVQHARWSEIPAKAVSFNTVCKLDREDKPTLSGTGVVATIGETAVAVRIPVLHVEVGGQRVLETTIGAQSVQGHVVRQITICQVDVFVLRQGVTAFLEASFFVRYVLVGEQNSPAQGSQNQADE